MLNFNNPHVDKQTVFVAFHWPQTKRQIDEISSTHGDNVIVCSKNENDIDDYLIMDLNNLIFWPIQIKQ